MRDDSTRDGEPVDESRDVTDGSSTWRPTRRRVLEAGAAATTVAGLGGLAISQQGGDQLDPSETIVLTGRVEGWVGRQPASIEGETNPTLNLAAGNTYDLTWINDDGLPHNFVILDPEESQIRRTEIIEEQGAEQSLSFQASEQMATYLCEVHPTSMRGAIQTQADEGEQPEEPAIAQVPEGPEIGLQRIAGGPLSQPVAMETVSAQDQEHQFIVDQSGEIYARTQEGDLREFLDITPRLVARNEGFDERGLLGLAPHPNFESNGRFYVRYSGFPQDRELPEDYDHMFILSEFEASGDPLTADPESERILLEIPEPQLNHNAGDIDFGPDGMLYVTVGDGGGADDTGIGHVQDWYETNRGGNGQDVTENLLGSILRIDVDDREGDLPYGVPSDNPLVGTDGLDEHYAWGFRNPWRMSFNDGQLIVADVGQVLWEEIDIVERGGNYGWNVREGAHCFSTEEPSNPDAITECPTNAPEREPYNGQPLIDPVLEYPHTIDGQAVGISVTGGYVYTGDALSELDGRYVFGDWSASFQQPSGRLWIADLPEADQGDQQAGAGNATNVTDADGMENVTVDNETDAAQAGNETGDGQAGQAAADLPMQELVIAGSDDGTLNRTVLAFGRDSEGELYVLTSDTPTIDGSGEVFKIVPPGEGDQISPPEGQQQQMEAENETNATEMENETNVTEVENQTDVADAENVTNATNGNETDT